MTRVVYIFRIESVALKNRPIRMPDSVIDQSERVIIAYGVSKIRGCTRSMMRSIVCNNDFSCPINGGLIKFVINQHRSLLDCLSMDRTCRQLVVHSIDVVDRHCERRWSIVEWWSLSSIDEVCRWLMIIDQHCDFTESMVKRRSLSLIENFVVGQWSLSLIGICWGADGWMTSGMQRCLMFWAMKLWWMMGRSLCGSIMVATQLKLSISATQSKPNCWSSKGWSVTLLSIHGWKIKYRQRLVVEWCW